MSFYVKQNGGFVQAEPICRECPHCGSHAELRVSAPPSFDHLIASRPRHAGIVFECAACKEPRFARLAVRNFGEDAVELSSNIVEVERAKEKFSFSYLPAGVAPAFAEALDCYTADLFTAFGVMCRRATQAAVEETRQTGGPRLPELFAEAIRIADIDGDTELVLQTLLFDGTTEEPTLDATNAAVLIEVLKDVFYECYVRRAKLRAAVRMRRFFAGETTQKVTPIGAASRHLNSA